MRTRLPRAVFVLGLVSLLMDVSSEMLYPIGPIYLVSIGASVAWIGIIEGLAEAIAGLSKGYFGSLSDSVGRRRPFVTLGYVLSALSKPIPAFAASVGGVLGSRVIDRIGKGVRTAPRDALIAGYVTEENRGAAFGLHRAMDTVGAAIGPIIALAYLAVRPGDYTTLFLLAFIPSALAALATLLVRESRFAPAPGRPGIAASLAFWSAAPSQFRRVVALLTLFALVNASDVFLILRARELGFDDTAAIGGYIGYNLVFAAAAYPAGLLSDRYGRRRIALAGFALYVVVYLGFAFADSIEVVWALFALYGIYAASTEGIAKAWLSDLVPNERRGLALGLQATLASLAALVASGWTGAIWSVAGASTPLAITAGVAAIVGLGLAVLVPATGADRS
ncbi:MAG TPA: MFS transporter [Candidatus Kapabacteria bacterium]|nr:MFS transporter [Candidatus Kapabacteria bacterium]